MAATHPSASEEVAGSNAHVTPANVSILKNGRAKAVRFTTLDAICKALDCQPGDILEWEDDD